MTKEELNKILDESGIVSLDELGSSFAVSYDEADEFNERELKLLATGYRNGFLQGFNFAKTGRFDND